MIPTFRLLMIEDDQARVDLIQAWLPKDCMLVVACNAGKAKGILHRDRGYVYGGLMFDHDLRERAMTTQDLHMSGSDLVATVVECLSRDASVLVHSMNPSRAPRLAQRLSAAGFDVVRLPFADLDRDRFTDWLEDARANWVEAHRG